jgi:hypothetical protein
MRPTGKDREQQLFMRDCLIQVYWEWRANEEWEVAPRAARWELLESCIARINCEVFRGL